MSTTRPLSPIADDALADAYLRCAARAKLRRLSGLVVLCALLLTVLLLIYARGWYSGSGGAGWVFVGIGVTAAAIAAVVIDIVYRKEL
ncbi:hypothetical protein [Streptomyces hygroscopicus]|uniref:hypothetical protein n=1 Tax=Streptomyces hygroscopicus TaxID=1912 RepID=UPI000826D058|nr:hypothetical protein [Streptomyces hygroscopicus]